mgnify:CR=1 FL=1
MMTNVSILNLLRLYIAPRFTINTIQRMKRLLLGVLAACCSTIAYSQATEIVVETYAENIGMTGTADLTGYNTYRVYVKFASDEDFLTAVYGDVDYPTKIQGGDNFFNAEIGGRDNEGYNPALFALFAELEYDSFITIGMTAPAVSGNGEAPINAVGDPSANWIPEFEPGNGATGADIVIDTQTGGSWFPLFPNSNAYAGEDSLVLIGQFTTDTVLYGVVSVATFVGGVQANDSLVTIPFSSVADAVFGCTDSNANNYDMDANEDNGSCVYACDFPGTQLVVTETASNDVSCSGYADGFASVSVSGGQGSLTFSNGISENATGLFGGVVAGEVTITVTDNVGCTTEAMVTVGSPEALDVMASLSDPISCNGETDAVLSGNSTGGTGMVTYSLEAPIDTGGLPYFENGSENLLFENIGVGLYTVYAIDENGCVDNTPGISIEQPQPFSLYAQAIVPTNCPDSEDGIVVLNYFGGSGNTTTYSVDGVSFDENTTFDLSPGMYTFYAQDVNGCLDTLMDVEVTTPPQFVAQEELTSPSCFGDADGALTVEVQGGSSPISYVYAGDTLDMVSLDMIAAGNYAIEVVDGNGCSFDASVDLSGPSEIVATATVTDVLCSDSEDGVIDVTAAGGSGMGYTYAIDNGSFGPNAGFDGLLPGDYTITVQDDAECAGSATFTVDAPDAIVVTVEANDGANGSEADGVLDITVEGGIAPYGYSWTGPGFTGTEEDPSGIAAGDYEVTITDGNGCVFTSTTIVVVSGIEEMVRLIDLNLFPNPTNGDVTVSMEGLTGESVLAVLTDGLGREVSREDLGNLTGQYVHTLDLSSVEAGIYYLQMNVANAAQVLRIVKQ